MVELRHCRSDVGVFGGVPGSLTIELLRVGSEGNFWLEGESGEEGEDFDAGLVEGGGVRGGHLAGDGVDLPEEVIDCWVVSY